MSFFLFFEGSHEDTGLPLLRLAPNIKHFVSFEIIQIAPAGESQTIQKNQRVDICNSCPVSLK